MSIDFNDERWEIIKEKNINKIILEGLRPINLSSNQFNYNDDSSVYNLCSNNSCKLHINITNNLNHPIYLFPEFLVSLTNKKSLNITDCIFTGANLFVYNTAISGTNNILECDQNYCEVSYRTNSNESSQEIVKIRLYLDQENKVIGRAETFVNGSMSIHAEFTITC